MKSWKVAAGLFVFLAALFYVSHTRALKGASDFDTYTIAATDVRAGRDIYRRDTGNGPYLYLPFFACLFTPLTQLPFSVAHGVWFAFNSLSFFLILFLLGKLFDVRLETDRKSFWPSLFVVVWTFSVFADNLSMDQADIFVALCMVGALACWKKHHGVAAGSLLVAGAAVKVLPFLFFFYFLAKREWKVIFGFLTGVALWIFLLPSLFFGFQRNLGLLNEWKEQMIYAGTQTEHKTPEELKFYRHFADSAGLSIQNDREAVRYHRKLQNLLNRNNQSLDAVLHRLFLKDLKKKAFDETMPIYNAQRYAIVPTLQLSEDAIRRINSTLNFILLASTFCWVWMSRKKEALRDLGFSLFVLLSVIFCPEAKSHMFILAIVPIFLMHHFWRLEIHAKARTALAASMIGAISFYFLQAIPSLKAHGSGLIFLLILWADLLGYGFWRLARERGAAG